MLEIQTWILTKHVIDCAMPQNKHMHIPYNVYIVLWLMLNQI